MLSPVISLSSHWTLSEDTATPAEEELEEVTKWTSLPKEISYPITGNRLVPTTNFTFVIKLADTCLVQTLEWKKPTKHVPASLWAVVNTAGYACKGRLEAQESAAWELMFRVNVVATLRTARALLPLLRVTQGRLVTLGLTGECCADGSGAVAYSAARHAVAGCSSALRQEIQPTGVSVIVVDAPKIRAETLYRPVRPKQEGGVEAYTSYRTDLLPEYFLSGLEEVLLSNQIKERYELRPPVTMSSFLQQRRKSNSHSTV
nr:uncharacterized protein LOC106684354 [Halyomorpha halys]